jgi:hypothetical protein
MDPFADGPSGNFAFPHDPPYLSVTRSTRSVGKEVAHVLTIWYAQGSGGGGGVRLEGGAGSRAASLNFSIAPVLQLSCDWNKQPSLDAYISGGTNATWAPPPGVAQSDSYPSFLSLGYPVRLEV